MFGNAVKYYAPIYMKKKGTLLYYLGPSWTFVCNPTTSNTATITVAICMSRHFCHIMPT